MVRSMVAWEFPFTLFFFFFLPRTVTAGSLSPLHRSCRACLGFQVRSPESAGLVQTRGGQRGLRLVSSEGELTNNFARAPGLSPQETTASRSGPCVCETRERASGASPIEGASLLFGDDANLLM